MNDPAVDPVTTGTVLGWAASAFSALLAFVVGFFSRTNAAEHATLATLIKDHEERIRRLASETNDAKVTAEHAKALFASAVETAHLYQKNTITELTAVIQLTSEKTRAALDLAVSETGRKIDAVHSRLDLAGIVRHRTQGFHQDDGA